MRWYHNDTEDEKNKVVGFQEFVNACINKLLAGGAALIVLYFICKYFYGLLTMSF